MGNSLLVVRDINHKYIVVKKEEKMSILNVITYDENGAAGSRR